MEYFNAAIFAVFGLLIGSFLNVCIYRIPRKESIVFGRSHCAGCSAEIAPRDLIPVLSYLFLGGKCRSCKAKISQRYPLVELLNGILYALVYLRFGFSLKTLVLAALVSVLIAVSGIDIDTREIPNGLVIALLILGAASFFTGGVLWWERLIGFAAASGILLLLALVWRDSMGGGDIKLMAAVGLILGWKLILLALLMAFILGGAYGAALLLLKKAARRDSIAFAPALSAGIVFAALFGEALLRWYAHFF